MNTTNILNNLNPAQSEAVSAPVCSMLVLAGAGSGKTRVLVYRIAWLVTMENMFPSSILAVTFTNKAAKEMKERVLDLLDFEPKGMWIGTFHGLSHKILRMHYQAAFLPDNFQIIDSDDQLRLIKRIMKSMNVDDKNWPSKQVQWYINNKKDHGLRPDYIDPGYNRFDQTMLEIYRNYHLQCQQLGVVDFAELLLRAHELLLNRKDILEHYQRRFKYLLVDEFQDTNTIQYAWLRLLVGNEEKLMVVGDDDQSIYGWRGAEIENILKFSSDYPKCKTVKLETNYRSSANILTAANTLISNNPDRLNKKLITQDNDGALIKLYAAFNELEEARFIAQQIENLVGEGINRKDIAVLYRSNAQSRQLEEAMLRAGVPYRVYGGHRFFDRMEIKNALAYLRLISNPHENSSMERVINIPPRGLGEKTLMKLREIANQDESSLWSAIQFVLKESTLTKKTLLVLSDFVQMINFIRQKIENDNTVDPIELLLEKSGLLDFHAKEKDGKGESRVENLEELITAYKQFNVDDYFIEDNQDQPSKLDAFLAHSSLEGGELQAAQLNDCVQMMTLHAVKGLEFNTVFISGLEEGLFPSRMSMEDGKIDEERRLCYVGITRAKRKLYLTYAENRRLYGNDMYNQPSKFIREIPSYLIEEVKLGGRVVKKVAYKPSSIEGYKLGMRFNHKVFGEGVLVNIEGQGAQIRLQVNFDHEGSKWLLAQYAKLEVVD